MLIKTRKILKSSFYIQNSIFFLLIALKVFKTDSDGLYFRPFWKCSWCDERSCLLSGERCYITTNDLIDINWTKKYIWCCYKANSLTSKLLTHLLTHLYCILAVLNMFIGIIKVINWVGYSIFLVIAVYFTFSG